MEDDQRRWTKQGVGEVVESEDTIILEAVPVVTPNKDVIVGSLSFEVKHPLLSLSLSLEEAHTHMCIILALFSLPLHFTLSLPLRSILVCTC